MPADHPCLIGHFPGNPIVPAVLLLQNVLDAVQAWRGPQWRMQRLLAAKFLSPLRPEESFDILLQMTDTRVAFRCERASELLAQGSLEVVAIDIAPHLPEAGS